MEISNLLLEERYVVKPFYCCFNDKEYILQGSEDGLIFEEKSIKNIGSIIIEISENRDFIFKTIKKYKNLILYENYSSNKVENENTIWLYLRELQQELEKSNIKYFSYINIVTELCQKYLKKINTFDKEQLHLNTTNLYEYSKKNINDLKYISYLEEKMLKEKQELDISRNLSFKDFVINEFDKLIDGLNFFLVNLILYSNTSLEIEDKNTKQKTLINPFEKKKLLIQNFNLNIFDNNFSQSKCFSRVAFLYHNDLYIGAEISKLKDIKNLDFKIIQIYPFENILTLLNLSFVKLIDRKINLKFCENCKNIFIPENRSDEKYCNRKSPQNPAKTCKIYGSKKAYREKQKDEPIYKEHNRTAQFFRMRRSRCKPEEKDFYKQKLDNYLSEYILQKEKYKSEDLSAEDFIEWIIKQKEGVKNGCSRTNKKQKI